MHERSLRDHSFFSMLSSWAIGSQDALGTCMASRSWMRLRISRHKLERFFHLLHEPQASLMCVTDDTRMGCRSSGWAFYSGFWAAS